MIENQPKITIIIPVTRKECLDKLFESLKNLVFDYERTDILFYVDCIDGVVIDKINTFMVTSIMETIVHFSGNEGVPNVRISKRRDRIVEVHKNIQHLIPRDTEYIMGLEDDTIFPADALQRMLPVIMRDNVGFIEGVQVGRWGIKMIGAWRTDDVENPTKMITLPFLDTTGNPGKYLERIDAGGFYCFMTKANLYKEANFEWHDECFGPDVCYSLNLRKLGFKNYIDWGLICGHDDYGKILMPDKKVEVVVFNKNEDKWEREENERYKC